MAATLDDLVVALSAAEEAGGSRATSIRLPEALHRAVLIATELGMDESFTVATSRALEERVGEFVRRMALAEHFSRFPEDVPSLADVAMIRVRGSGHPGASRPDLIEETAAWMTKQRPDWALSGAVDETVDEVLGYVEMFAAGVGRRESA